MSMVIREMRVATAQGSCRILQSGILSGQPVPILAQHLGLGFAWICDKHVSAN